MGASDFLTVTVGPDAATAFRRAVEDAAYEHGHGGYTGTVAEKGNYRTLTLPSRLDGFGVMEFLRLATSPPFPDSGEDRWRGCPVPLREDVHEFHRAVEDKWGPAGLVEITATAEGQKRLDAWLATQRVTGLFEIDRRTGKRTRVGPEPTTDGQWVFVIFGWASC